MAFISILIVDILILVVLFNIVVGLILGIIGFVLHIKNRKNEKQGNVVSKKRKIITLVFCIFGIIAVCATAFIVAFYFLKIK